MKDYGKRLKITGIIFVIEAFLPLIAAVMLLVVVPQLSAADREMLGLTNQYVMAGVAIGLITSILYFVAGISGIRAAKGTGSTSICKKSVIILIIIVIVDMVISLVGLGFNKKITQGIVNLIIMGIYYNAAVEHK